ncbi:copper-binding protein [Breoghania sp. L-A4]|uniref:copper-binding protein n=1 Tax=Breoghania sp. L-A4 TaxID=2304600 RepID=UPI000E3602DF|nr:copper-binding protein [Breoghania sp. L-A4]AXS39354.1 copper-binding protein [Breoghania sp. L-A4]
MRPVARAFLLAATVAAAAATAFAAPAGAAAGQRPPATHSVDIVDFRFVPERLDVRPGDTVVWRNRDLVAHTASADDGSWDTGIIGAHESVALVVDEGFTAAYACLFHPMMKARLERADAR